MASSGMKYVISKSETVTSLQCKTANSMRNDGKHLRNEKIIVDKQEMVNLREEMKELANQLKLIASNQVSEVIQQKVNTIIGKIDSFIQDIVGKRGNAQVRSENNKSKPSSDKQL
jgi:hypothetical protein